MQKYVYLHRDMCALLTVSGRFIDGETGKRSDVAHHYIYNHTQNTGLEILPGTLVKRVIFE